LPAPPSQRRGNAAACGATAAWRRAGSLIRSGCDALKARLGKLLQRIRGTRSARWPWSPPRVADRGAALPRDRTGWTVHRDIWTFAAYDEGRLAGTVSLRLDTADGLAADDLYRAEIDAIRRNRRKVCEFTRLAVDASRLSQPVLAGLFHTAYLFAQRVRDFDFVVVEVNPRHVGFYRRSLGFRVIGDERHNAHVEAPAVLLGISFADIAEHLRRHAGMARRAPRARSLYAYGFSPAEEAGVLGRLRVLNASLDTNPKSGD